MVEPSEESSWKESPMAVIVIVFVSLYDYEKVRSNQNEREAENETESAGEKSTQLTALQDTLLSLFS